ncbi:hypothetical protein [Microbacterium sp.]|uniref:hypothetical protein n=1 Tax=Microbacterium sp. TaxID=51671 RepID=UPI002811AE6D|nr:hypothetical protein [Microbacterium sp.]
MGRGARGTDGSSARAFILGGLAVIVVTLVLMGLAASDANIGNRGETMLVVGIPAGVVLVIMGVAKLRKPL